MVEPGGAAKSKAGPGAVTIWLRVILAVAGSYAVAAGSANLTSSLLARAGVERNDAVAWATLAAFPLFLGLGLLAFAARSTLRLAIGMAAAVSVMFAGAHRLGGG